MGTELSITKRNRSYPPEITGYPREGLFVPTADQRYRLGTRYRDRFGRVWRYARNGAVALGVALMASSEAVNANVKEQAQTTGYGSTIGDKQIKVLVTTSNGISDGELADGWLLANKATGIGYSYPIADNKWVTGDTVMLIDLEEPIRVATSTDTEFTLVKNPYADVVVEATTVIASVAGVPNVVIPATYYGWLQTAGPCPLITDAGDTVVVGCLVGQPATHGTAGGAGVPAITTDVWGRVITVGAAGEPSLVDLFLE